MKRDQNKWLICLSNFNCLCEGVIVSFGNYFQDLLNLINKKELSSNVAYIRYENKTFFCNDADITQVKNFQQRC